MYVSLVCVLVRQFCVVEGFSYTYTSHMPVQQLWTLSSVSLSCEVPHISLWHKFLHMAMHISCCVYIMLINFYFSVIKNTKSLSIYCSVLLLIITFQQICGVHTHTHAHTFIDGSQYYTSTVAPTYDIDEVFEICKKI